MLRLLNELRLPLKFLTVIFLGAYEVDRELLDTVRLGRDARELGKAAGLTR